MKNTLFLPKTDFPIQAKLTEREPLRYAKWTEEDVYHLMQTGKKEPFLLHDGPPYANGDIHVGHALNKILKDFIVKWNFFNGSPVEFTPGWDCHGLPIEQKVVDKTSQVVDVPSKQDHCRTYAKSQVDGQREQFKSLGIVADWDRPYLTMWPDFELMVYKSLVDLLQKELLYTMTKPVPWSWKAETALAEAEIEYKDEACDSIYVLFPTDFQYSLAGWETVPENVKLLVWTTTPWTLPANEMVAAAEGFYCICKLDDPLEQLVFVAKNRVEALQADGVIGDVIGMVESTDLKNIKVYKPLNCNKTSPLVWTDTVQDKGTGFIHIAPGHGQEDYQLAIWQGVREWAMPVSSKGCYTDEVQKLLEPLKLGNELVGVHVLTANKMIVKALDTLGLLGATRQITHSYPYCSRTDTPLIFRSTPQWFLSLYKLEAQASSEVKNNVKFDTESARERLLGMVKNRPDWCISRQRFWGVPLAFLRHKKDGGINMCCDKQLSLFATHGIETWWTRPIEDFCPDGVDPNEYEKVTDVLDVWFDSGLTWQILKGRQADLYLEGHDQHRGWFQSSLWLSVALTGKAPYKKVVTHGFVVDGKGEKMAKSKGNVVSPLEVTKEYGSEVLRYWVATTDYHKDLRINKEILGRCSEGYKKIRNTIRYLLANLDDSFDPDTFAYLTEIDAWIMVSAAKVFDEVNDHFQNCEFHQGMHKLIEFINTRLSNIWMGCVKDTLYCDSKTDWRRKSAQYAVCGLLHGLLGLLAPIFTYTVDEALEYTPEWFRQGKDSIFKLDHSECAWSMCKRVKLPSYIDWDNILALIGKFHEAFDPLKQQGIVKEPLDVVLEASDQSLSFARVTELFGVSGMWIVPYRGGEVLAQFECDQKIYYIRRSIFGKCPRCWKRDVIQNEVDPTELCTRCKSVVAAISTQ